MTFRVIAGTTNQGAAKAEGDKSVAPRPAEPRLADPQVRMHSTPLATPDSLSQNDLAPVAQLLDRLESLSFTFEALNAGSRTYAAEAVLETLARMERRDLQALAAIEALASALKTVSQHLAGLRNAVQSTAHETAAGLEHVAQRLDRLEGRAGTAQPEGQAIVLAGIAERLAAIESHVAEPVVAEPFDSSPLSEMLETIARRVSRIERKVGEIPAEIKGEKFDPIPITTLLETIARRLSRVERKVEDGNAAGGSAAADLGPVTTAVETVARRVSRIERALEERAPAAFDAAPINTALETIARRVSRIEKKVEAPGQASSPLNEALAALAQRVADVEHKMDAGDGTSIAACLLTVAERLARIEAGLAASPAPAAEPVAAPSDAIVVAEPAAEAVTQQAAPAEPAAEVAVAATVAEPALPAPVEAPAAEPPAPPADQTAGARPRVDLLLEQVFRVLSR